MSIPVECRTCGAKLKVKGELAGRLARCPKCKMGISIPKLAAVTELEARDDLDFNLIPEPSQARPSRKPTRPATDVEDELEFLDADELEEEILPKLPPLRKKKKPAKKHVRSEPHPVRSRGDLLVWVLLLAMIPLRISVVLPETSLEQRVQKMVANHPDLQEELEEYGAQDFMEMNTTVRLTFL